MALYPADVEALAAAIIDRYSKRGWRIAAAESCTGGLIAGALTEIPGSSAVFDRGFVTYSNEAKKDLIGVSATTLDRFGAVSRETALQMARGALMRSEAEVAVSVTGIAGPGGGSVDKPVGLVHLALVARSGEVVHRRLEYGDVGRSEVRLQTLKTALDMLLAAAYPSA